MFVDVEKYIKFIVKNKLTQAQFLFMYLIYRKKWKAYTMYKEAFPADESGHFLGKFLLDDLIKREFIEVVGETGKTGDYKLTEKFTDLYFNDIFIATEELKSNYPAFTIIGGNQIPLTAVDIYQIAGIYGERIDHSVEEHKEVIKDLIYARDKGAIRMSLEKFVRGEIWKGIRPSRLANSNVQVLVENFGD